MQLTISIRTPEPEKLKEQLGEDHFILTIHLPKSVKLSYTQVKQLQSEIDADIAAILHCTNVSILSKGMVTQEELDRQSNIVLPAEEEG